MFKKMETNNKISKFNLAGATLERLNECMIKTFNRYQGGDIESWFFGLKGIKMQVIARLNPEERKKFKELELKIAKCFLKNNTRPLAAFYIEEYNELLQDALESKGLLLIDKEDETIWT